MMAMSSHILRPKRGPFEEEEESHESSHFQVRHSKINCGAETAVRGIEVRSENGNICRANVDSKTYGKILQKSINTKIEANVYSPILRSNIYP
jgi:hypothetical protein